MRAWRQRAGDDLAGAAFQEIMSCWLTPGARLGRRREGHTQSVMLRAALHTT
jgi:hypothetical protein